MMELWPFTNFHDLNLDWIIKTIKTYTKKVDDLYNTGLYDFVEKVLEAHPEWTTTVMDGAISTAKLMDGAVTNDKLAEGVGDCWVDDIGLETFRDDQTDRFVATIPAVDAAGDVIKPLMGAEHTPITPAVYARQIGSTFTGNVGCAIQTTSNTLVGGCIINDNEIIEPATVTGATLADNDCGYIAINADRTWRTYPIMTPPESMVNDGVQYAFDYWFRLVENYTALDLSNVHAGDPAENIINGTHPRSAIGFRADNSIVYYACGGRTFDQKGMTAPEVAAEMVRLGCKSAFMMDGGGSTSFSFKCAKLNPNIDDRGLSDRMVRGSINFVKPDCNNFMADAFSFTGQIRQLTMTQIRRFVNYWNDYFTDGLGTTPVTDDPLDYVLNMQPFSIKGFTYTGDDPQYQYNMFIAVVSYSQRFILRFQYSGHMIGYNTYGSGEWTGWQAPYPINLGHGELWPTVPANGSIELTVNLAHEAPNTYYTPIITEYFGNANLHCYLTDIQTTYFKFAITNSANSAASPGIRWAAIWSY